jgi:hypothetical protein
MVVASKAISPAAFIEGKSAVRKVLPPGAGSPGAAILIKVPRENKKTPVPPADRLAANATSP